MNFCICLITITNFGTIFTHVYVRPTGGSNFDNSTCQRIKVTNNFKLVYIDYVLNAYIFSGISYNKEESKK